MALLLPVASCVHEPEAAAESATEAAVVPHGDHTPRYGGVVYMEGDLHFEVVLDRSGRHRVYFSDAVRAELPASTAAELTLVLSRPSELPEMLVARIDESGESWIAQGRPVDADDVWVRVAFVVASRQHWIDVPFVVPEPPAARETSEHRSGRL